ncbi:MAG TPA: glutathione S-transferase family protein [Gemmatimonadota bacterium]|nr:glutathione S-transferase family protein [Gemmatimonadota bacterium]
MIRLYAFPLSLNAERVALALAHKRLEVEVVEIDPGDRTLVRRVSGQDLVPVIEENGRTVFDSTAILRHLEAGHPDPPLFPRDPARREELDVFLDWFNEVWKRPPNLIIREEAAPAPEREAIAKWGREMARSLDRFEALLAGRDHLMGDEFSAADCAAWPFVRYAVWRVPDDPWRYHHVLMENLEARPARHPRLIGWIERMAERPRISLEGGTDLAP